MDSGEKAALGGHQSRQEQVLTKHLRGKAIEWASMADRGQPLQLLDLPVDILQAVIKEVTNTNDLTSLALTHSALHALVIPHIYSRFDIVWPDNNSAVETRVGVDALTYGLNTLVMDHDVFGEARTPRTSSHPAQKCGHCGKLNQCSHGAQPVRRRRIRRGNNFAQYTRKFSLGNGPMEWVQEYAITKEAGKMLGTLIALAVGRMRNLEAFIFDMPTGVLRDVWLALASLDDRDDGQECRLEQVWVRWHDNSDQAPLGPTSLPGAAPTLIQPSHASGTYSTHISHPPLFSIPPYPRVEFPTFSILPPLKSLSVLDIDELPYAEEMSVLLERSVHKLRELRLGIAQHAHLDAWVRPLEDQVHAASLNGNNIHPSSRPGGILGLLVSRFCDVFRSTNIEGGSSDLFGDQKNIDTTYGPMSTPMSTMDVPSMVQAELEDSTASAASLKQSDNLNKDAVEAPGTASDEDSAPDVEIMTASFAAQDLREPEATPPISELQSSDNTAANDSTSDPTPVEASSTIDDPSATPRATSNIGTNDHMTRQASSPLGLARTALFPECHEERTIMKLKLEVLELERVPISIPVLSRAIDWSRLTCLTILGCRNHEQLWKALRKQFSPGKRSSSGPGFSISGRQGTPGRPLAESSSRSRYRMSIGAEETAPGMTYDSFPLVL